MANKTREALEKRVRNAIFQEAIFRTESAMVIAATMLLATASAIGLPGVEILPYWGWLLGGMVAEGALIATSLTDPQFGRKVAAAVLRRDFKPEKLKNRELQLKWAEALDYRTRIDAGIQSRSDTLIKDELTQTVSQIDEWLGSIYDLALRIDRYLAEENVLQRDKERAQKRLQELQKRLTAEDNTAVKNQLNVTIEGVQRQLETLDTLENTIQRARLQLENSLTHLGTIYSQTMLVDAKDIDRSRARRLRQEIADEVTELDDLLVSMEDVYAVETF